MVSRAAGDATHVRKWHASPGTDSTSARRRSAHGKPWGFYFSIEGRADFLQVTAGSVAWAADTLVAEIF
jgi:hypothetical protein